MRRSTRRSTCLSPSIARLAVLATTFGLAVSACSGTVGPSHVGGTGNAGVASGGTGFTGGGGGALGGETSAGAAGATAGGGTSGCDASVGTMADPDTIATRLAQFIWNEPVAPDSLRADSANARSPAAVSQLATRMLQDPKARTGVAAFFTSWLRLTELGTISKPTTLLSPALIASMQQEAPAFGVAVVLDGDARYATLMEAPYTYVDETLARHYGMAGVTGDTFRQVPYETSARIGILMGAGVLARFAGSLDRPWPPRRFWLMYEAMLCDKSALPPAVMNSPRDPQYVTVKDNLLAITSRAACDVCHASVNPVGLAFSAFDTYGRFVQVDEAGVPVVTAGDVPAGLALDDAIHLSDGADLIRQLATRASSRRCFSARWLEYALQPRPIPATAGIDRIAPDLECSLDQADGAFASAGGDTRVLISAIAATPAFLSP